MTISKIKLPGASAAQDIKDSGAQRRYTGTVQWDDNAYANVPYPSPSDAAYGDLFIASDGIDASGRSNISMALHYGTSLRISRNGTSTTFNKTSTITVKVHTIGDGPDTYRKYRIYIQSNYLNVYKTVNNGGGEGDETRIGYRYITTLSSNPFYIEDAVNAEITWTETDTENPDLDDYITFDLVYKSEGVYQHNGTSWEAAPDLSKKADKATMPGGILPSDMIAELDDYGNLKYNGHKISDFATKSEVSGKQSYYNCPLAEVTSPKEGDVCVVPETEEEVTADSNGDFAINGVSVRIEETESHEVDPNFHIKVFFDVLSETYIEVRNSQLPYTYTNYEATIYKVNCGSSTAQYYKVYKIVPQMAYTYHSGAWVAFNATGEQKTYQVQLDTLRNIYTVNSSMVIASPNIPHSGDIGTYSEIVKSTISTTGAFYSYTFDSAARNIGLTTSFKIVRTATIPNGSYSSVYIMPTQNGNGRGYKIVASAGFYGPDLSVYSVDPYNNETILQSPIATPYYVPVLDSFSYQQYGCVREVFPNGNETSLLNYLEISHVLQAGVLRHDGTSWKVYAPEEKANKVETIDTSSSSNETYYPSVAAVIKYAQAKSSPTVDTSSTSASLYYYEVADGSEYRYSTALTSLTATALTASNLSLTSASTWTIWIVFTSGPTATSFTYPASWKWSGDDVDNGSFVPAVNKTYNICVWWDGVNLNAIARGTAYVASS